MSQMQRAKATLLKTYLNKVDDVENEGMDEGRFFIHLKQGWDFCSDPHNITRSESFGSAKDVIAAVKNAKPAK